MQAIWYEKQGPARDVLVLGDIDTPEPAKGEVRVKLMASGVNPADCNRRGGRGYGMEFPLVVPNSDGAGIVDAVGPGVSPDRIGRRVWLYNGQRGRAQGTAAEYICLPADLTAPLPDNTSFVEGACLGIPCMTAHYCVFSDGPIAGKTVLVAGGAGAVGHYAIQLARRGGARVVATVNADWKEADARRAGAETIVRYDQEPLIEGVRRATSGNGVDRIVEVDFGGNLAMDIDILRPNGSIVAYASRGNPAPSIPFYPMMRKNLSIRAALLPATPVEARHLAQSEIVGWLEEGAAIHRASGLFPLADTALAHEAVEAGSKRGTIVVLPAG